MKSSAPGIEWTAFGAQLRAFREASGFGQREIARRLGIDHAALCRAEYGKPISTLHYLVLCRWIDEDPFAYARFKQAVKLRSSRPRPRKR